MTAKGTVEIIREVPPPVGEGHANIDEIYLSFDLKGWTVIYCQRGIRSI